MADRRLTTAVIGAGTMGHGIAQVLALAGHEVRLQDPSAEALEAARASMVRSLALLAGLAMVTVEQAEAGHGNLFLTTSLAQACAGAGLVVESVPEDIALKRGLYTQIEELIAPEAILGSNTSALSITELARGLKHPERFVGVHFWNPAQVMPCVEVVKGRETSPQVFGRVVALMAAAGKEPVRVLKDVPGFLGNRLQHALQREALYLVEQGIAQPEDVDRVVKYGFGLRYAFMGPLERADLGGLDVTCAVQRYLLPDLDSRIQASPLLEERVARGELGLKTGQGFYTWSPEQAAQASRQRDLTLLSVIKLLKSLR